MAVVRGALVGLAVTITACSLASLDGYSDGVRSDDSRLSDGGPSEGSSPGTVDSAGGDSGALGWCATHAPTARFCADFDGRSISLFDAPSLDNGTVGVDTSASRSPPGALLATAGSRRSVVHSFVRTAVAKNASWAKMAFDLRVEGTHPTSGADVVHLTFENETKSYTVGFGVLDGGKGAYAYEYAESPFTYEERPLNGVFSSETWVHITVTADLRNKTVSLERDDVAGTLTAPLAVPLSGPLDLSLELGIAYAPAGENGWKVRIDNVVLDVE